MYPVYKAHPLQAWLLKIKELQRFAQASEHENTKTGTPFSQMNKKDIPRICVNGQTCLGYCRVYLLVWDFFSAKV